MLIGVVVGFVNAIQLKPDKRDFMALEQEPHTDTTKAHTKDGTHTELHFTRYFANNHLAVDIHQDIANYKQDKLIANASQSHHCIDINQVEEDNEIEDEESEEVPETIHAIFEDIEDELSYTRMQVDGKEITAFFLSGLFSSVFLLIASTFMCYGIHNQQFFIYVLISCIIGFLPACALSIWGSLKFYKRFNRRMRALILKKKTLVSTIQRCHDADINEQELRLIHQQMNLAEK
jgi:hypothetical protein